MDGQDQSHVSVREQDRFMPIANVIRIMRRVLPTHAKISDDAKETIQECVSEYISFVTGEANERCQKEQRKTVTAEDIIWAMSKLGFDDYIGPLSVYLTKYRDFEGDQRGSIRGEPLQVMKYGYNKQNHGGVSVSPVVTRVSHPLPQMQVQMQHYGFFGGDNGSFGGTGGGYYYSGSYGDGESSGAGSSEALPLMNNFDNRQHDEDHHHYGLNLK